MRNYLHLLLLLLSINLVAQTDDDCTTALGAVGATVAADGTILNLDNSGFTDEGNWTSGLLGGPISGFTAFQWNDLTGFYSINATSAGSGAWSITLNLDDGSGDECIITASEELFTGTLSGVATEISCFNLVNGQTYIIGYATDIGDENTLDLEFTSSSAAVPVNSECSMAEDQGTITTNCELNNFIGDFIDACPNPDAVMCLDLGSGPILWYTFTTDSNVEEVLIETNGASAITPQFALYSGGCGASGVLEGACQDDGTETYTVAANTTYWIAVGEETPAAGGDFSLDITASLTAVGEDCGIESLTVGGGSVDGSTTCASAPTASFCSYSTTTDHAVYYNFEVTGTDNVNLDVAFATSTAVTGFAAANLGFEIYESGCANALPSISTMGDPCAPLGATTVFECVPPGMYTIAIGSSATMAGDFQVTIDQLFVGPANDACANADATVALTDNCTPVTLSGTTVDACPEASPSTSCDYTTQSVVWHLITLPIDAIGVEITNILGAEITLFATDDCTVGTFFGAIDCATTDVMQDALVGGDSYLVGVSTDPSAEGMYSFEVTAIVPPANDLCSGAILLTDAVAENGSNNCATADVALCTLDGSTSHVVWYQYDITGTVNTGLNVNVSADAGSLTPMSGVSVQLVDACGGAIIEDISALTGGDDDCNNPLGIDVEYECLEGGTTVWIAVGSDDLEEGDFTITVSQVDPAPMNDECATAEDIDLSLSPCAMLLVNGDNTYACPEGFDADGCTYSTDPTVWFSVTLPTDAVGLEITDLTDDFYATYFAGNCGALLPIDPIAGCFTVEGNTETTYAAGDVILIAIASTAIEGAFSFNILPVVPPNNDMCDPDAEVIVGTENMATTVNGTTLCATPPTMVQDYCSLGTADSHVVWFEYTVQSTKNTDLNITITADAANGTPIAGASVELFMDCDGNTYDNDEINMAVECAALGLTLEYKCVSPEEVIFIAVGSIEGEEGDFILEVEENNINVPDNDSCDTPEAWDFTLDCVAEPFSADNTGACPELWTFASCDFMNNKVIFYSIALPMDAIGIEFIGIDNGEIVGLHPNLDCPPTGLEGPMCLSADDILLGLTGGNTYLLSVTLDAEAEGAIDFEMLAVVPPANDICDPDAEVLTSGTGALGTTVCATSDNTVCTLDDMSHVVYYTYTVTATTNTDLTIVTAVSTATSGTAANELVIEVWTDCLGTDLDIDPEEGVAAECSAVVDETLTYNCVPPGTVLTIAVGSSNTNEGDFEITVTEDADGIPTPANDGICDAEDIVLAADCTFQTVTTNNTGACPETPLLDGVSSCELDQDAVIWFSVFISNSATGLEFSDLTGGEYVAVFSGDCSAPVLEGDCLAMDGQILGLASNATYLIAVSQSMGNTGAIEFMIKSITPPPNDICDPDAIDLTSGNVSLGSTGCATSDDSVCTLDASSHVVYYTYTVTGTTNTDLTIETASSTATSGTAANDLVIEVWTDCLGTDFDIDPEEGNTAECNVAVEETLTYNCVPPGTILTIAVGSSDGNDGDFEITVTEDADGIATAINDVCDAPIILDVTDPCEWIDFSVSSVNGCPEDFDFGNNCGFDDFPITWYSFDTPADATTVEINILTNSAGTTPIYAIFENDCPTLTTVSNCETGLGEIDAPVDINPNTTYLLGIGSNDAAGSDLDIQIKITVPPANDDPCDAETLTAGTTTPGTNLCATEDYLDPNCAAILSEASVWYTYTLEAGVTGVEISFPSITATGPIDSYVVTFDAGCMAAPTMAAATAFTCDAGTLVDPITLNCLDPGTVLHISVSSEEANAGDFEILLETIDADPLCIDNDECDMLGGGADVGEIVTDEDCTVINDCNANACAEFIGDCGVEINNVVWYSVSNDGLGEFISASIENADFDEPVIAIFDGGCAALNQIGNCEFGSGGVANAGPFMIPADNAQYWIAVGSVGAVGGDFELCIEINSGCVNDEPCDAVELFDGVVVDNPASTEGCTNDTQNPSCVDGEFISVWYTFVVPQGFGAFEVTLSNVTIVDNIGVAIGEYSDANCAGLPAADVTSCEPGNQTIEFPCAAEGTEWFIQITSGEDMDEGDFEIQIDAIEPIVENDICSGIGPDHVIEITPDDYCDFVAINVNTEDACPEIFTAGVCDFTEGPAVWYEITIPNDPALVQMDVMAVVNSGFAGNLQVAILEVDCDDILSGVSLDCVSSGGDVEIDDITVVPGQTYQIVVGSNTAGDEGTATLSIKLDAPPENDDPCPTDINPPIDLSGGTGHDGTTCCARGANDDPSFDFANQECSGATDDDAVWYTFTPDGVSDGFMVTVQSSGGTDGIMGNTAIEIYSTTDPDGGCTGNLTIEESSCSSIATPVEFAISVCDPDLIYYIKVGSAEDDCGDFNILIINRSSNCAADVCEDAEVLVTETPAGCEDGENILSIEGCLEYACPEDVNVACMNDMGPTVWYQIDIDSDQATILVTQVEADGFEAMWSIWQSTTGSCDDMINVSQPQPAPDPAIPCGTIDNFIIPIVQDPPGTPATYWIAITAIGEITSPDFTLNYAGSLGCIACSGDDSFDCDNGEFIATIDGVEVVPEDFENFCPGQEVEICIEFNYNTAGTGNDWLHGIIPSFGEGWDLEATDFEAIDLGGGWEWIDYEGGCATQTSIYTLPNLCTYTNNDGLLQLCNTACDPNCPCDGPLLPSSDLPSGWFWSSNGGSTTCVNGSCIPLELYGVPGGVNVDVDVCFDLTTKAFADEDGDGVPDEDCELKKDLKVVFQTTSDAVSGCWEDNPCIIDPSLSGPDWKINCDVPPLVLGDDDEICNNGTLDIDLVTEDGTVVEIVVEVMDNPNVTGETDFNFPAGFGTIDNTLTNTGSATEVVIYEVYSVDPTKPCPGVTNTIEVTVYPELEVTFNDPLVVCAGETIEVIATATGGTGIDYQYQWGAPGFEITPNIFVTPVTTTTYVVTVTDDLGCTGSSEVQVFWNPPVEFELVPTMESICQNGVEINEPEDILFVDVVFTSGTAPFNITWDVDPGFSALDYIINNTANSNDQLEIFEETSTSGSYTLFVDVEDANGCVLSQEIVIEVGGAPFIIIQDIDVPCGGSDETVLIDAAAFFTVGPPVSMMELYDCDGILIFSNFGNAAAWEVDPNDFNCVVVVAIDQNGCEAREEIQLDLNAGAEPTLTGSSHCIGETSTVSVDNAALYSDFVWNLDGPGSTITAGQDTNFIYVVTVTDAVTGCTGVASYEVLVDPNPIASLAGSLSFCTGSTTTLTASGGTSYEWFSGASTGGTSVSATADIIIGTGNAAGDYTVEITNAAGCTSDSTVTVIEDANLLVSLNTLTLCDSDTDTLSAGESFDVYEWEDGDGNSLGSEYFVVVGGGTYCVTVTDNVAGCTGSTCTTITPNVSPTVEVTSNVEICREDVGLAPGVILDFNALVIDGSGTWIDLDFPAADLSDFSAADFTGANLGDYRFEYRTNTAIAPCEDVRDTLTVSVINCTCPSVAVFTDSLCNTAGMMYDLDDLKNTNEDVTWTSMGGNALTVTGSMVDIGGIPAGTYEFTMTLVNPVGGACPPSNTTSFVIVEEAVAVANDDTVCNEDTGNGSTTIDLNSTLQPGFTPGGAWTDVNGDPVPDIFDGNPFNPSDEFVFTYTVTGMTPCGDISTDVTITVIDCDCPQVMIVDPASICNDSGTINLDDQITTTEPGSWQYVSGGTTGTVVLEGGNVFNSNDGTTQLTSGLYIFNYVFDTNPGGDCPFEFPINIIVSNQPEVSAVTTSACNVMSDVGSTFVNLEDWISGDVGVGTWAAEPGSEAIDITDVTNVNFDGQDIGTMWSFTFTTAATAPCVPATATVVVTVANCDCPNINVMVPAPVCNSETTALDLADLQDPMIGTGAWTVLDPDGSNVALSGTELALDGIAAGDYMLTYTLDPVPATNCQPDSTVILSVSEQNFATLGMDQNVCVNDGSNGANFIDFNSLVIAGDTGGVWEDTDGAGVLLSDYSNVIFEFIDPDMAYTFTYTVSSDAPCVEQQYTIVINTLPCDCPLANPMDPSIECSDAGVIDLTQYNNATFPGTWSSTELTVTDNSVDITAEVAGIYMLTYTMDNPVAGCPDSWDTTIEISNPASAGTPEDALIFCEDETEIVDLAGLLTDEDAGGTWMETSTSTGGAFDPTGTFDIAGQAPGTYSFTYSIVGDMPCPDVSEMVEVIIEAVPNADAGEDDELDCIMTETTIGGASSTGASFTYEWTEAGGAPITDPTLAQITVTAAGVYTLVVTNTETMCTNTDMVTVTVSDDVPSFMLEFTDITCNGEGDGTITIVNPMGGNGDYSYSFNGGAFGTETSFTGLQDGDYTIVMMDSSGSGCESTQTATIAEPGLLVLDLGPPRQTNIGNEEIFTIEDQLGDFEIDNIVWTVDGEEICSDPTCTSITIEADQNANINVEVTYNGGCIAEALTQVLVTQVVDVVLPNVFSPNNDGANEVFYVNSDDVETVLSMRVYDRWGELVFFSENQPASDPTYGWNGTFKEQPLNPGVFVYVIEVLFVNGQTEVIGGDVTIVK